MTAVPGTDAGTVTLICDRCGGSETTSEARDQDVVWPLLGALGWTGSPFATGNHHCPPCDVQPPPAADSGPVTSRPHGASYELRVHDDLDTTVITALTDIDAEATGNLRQALQQAVRDHSHVLVDMRAAEVIDSSGLGMLVRARQDARQHGGTLALAAPSRYVLTVLHTMRLDGVFAVFENTAAALDNIRRH
jgi:anti-sigma B factor antagonist